MRLDFKVDTKLDDKKVLDAAKKTLAEAMLYMEGIAVSLCPVATGQLKNSIYLQMVNETHYVLHAPKNYAAHVEYGTRPHRIPKEGNLSAKTLHFEWKGQKVFFDNVWHPGTKAHPYFRPALFATEAKVPQIMKKYL